MPTVAADDTLAYSWVSLEIEIDGDKYELVKKMDWKITRELGIVRGTGGGKRRKTRGQSDYKGTIEFYLDAYLQMIDNIGNGWLWKEWNALAQYREVGHDDIEKVEWLGCSFTDNNFSNGEGAEATTVPCEVDITKILINGLDPWEDGDGVGV